MLGAILFLDLGFVRGRFCATTCPYAKLQGVLFDRSTLVVAYDERRDAECIDCLACVRVCPTGIDIRDGLQAECIACAQCVDACAPILAKFGRPTLVDYFWGAPGGRPRFLRPVVLALGAASLLAVGGHGGGRRPRRARQPRSDRGLLVAVLPPASAPTAGW